MDVKELSQAIQDGGIPAWATEATLQKVAKALGTKGGFGDIGKTIGRTGDTNPRTLIGGLGSATGHVNKLGQTAGQTSKVFDVFKTALGGGAGLLGTLATSRGKFADLNPIIDAVGSGLKNIADEIPVVGGFFKALVGLTVEVTKLNNVIIDDLIDSFYGLGKAGFALSGQLQQLQIDANSAGIGFSTLTEVVTKNAAGILAFGGDIETGSRNFVNALTVLTKTDGEFATSLKSFGYSAEETAEFLGEFITVNRNNQRLQSMDQQQLAQATFDYAKNLRIISELTGTEVDQLREARIEQLQVGAFQAKLQDMRNKGDFVGAERTAAFAAELAALSPQMSNAFMAFTAMDDVFANKQSALMDLNFGLEEAFVNRDFDTVRQKFAGFATDSNMLGIAQLGLLDNTNEIIDLLSDITNDALRVAGVLEGGPTQAELITQTEAQISALGKATTELGTFETNVINAATAIERLPLALQSFVIENLQKATAIQVDLISGFINKFRSGINSPQVGDTFDSVIGPITIPKPEYGGGPTGGGMYLVGERGPELLRLSQGSMGHVYNHGQTKSMLRGRFGGGPVNGAPPGTPDYDFISSAGMSLGVDPEGKPQVLKMSIDYDTILSFYNKQGLMEVIRSFVAGENSDRSYMGGKLGASMNMKSGKGETFFQEADGSRIYGNDGINAMVRAGMASDPTAGPEQFKELIANQKELNKIMKSYMGKITSGASYF